MLAPLPIIESRYTHNVKLTLLQVHGVGFLIPMRQECENVDIRLSLGRCAQDVGRCVPSAGWRNHEDNRREVLLEPTLEIRRRLDFDLESRWRSQVESIPLVADSCTKSQSPRNNVFSQDPSRRIPH